MAEIVFTTAAVLAQIRGAADEIKREARAIVRAAAEATAGDARRGYTTPAFREVNVIEKSPQHYRVSVLNRHVNFFDIGQDKGGKRQTSLGYNRGQVTPQRVMGPAASARRRAMWQSLEALAQRRTEI